MKNLFKLNLVFVGVPILFCLMGIWDKGFLIWAAFSTIPLGLFHLIIGFGMYGDEPNDKNLQRYCALVLIFFATWIFTGLTGYGTEIMRYLMFLPPLLALYLTAIIYKKRSQ